MNWAYVLYAEHEAPLWHQRRIMGRVAPSACDVIALMPDGDVYSESYIGNDNGDIQAVRYGVFGEVSLGVPRSAVYRFRQEPSTAEVEGAMVQARVIAEQECRERAAAVWNPRLLDNLLALMPLFGSGPGGTSPMAQAAPRVGYCVAPR